MAIDEPPQKPRLPDDRDPMDNFRRVEDYYYRRPGDRVRPRPRFVGDTLPPPAPPAPDAEAPPGEDREVSQQA